MGDWPNNSRLSALNIRQAVEGSLKRLQTDHIDLYQMHHIDRNTPWEEIWQAMEALVQQGKVLYVGSSNFAGWHIAKANEIARVAPLFGVGERAMPLQPEGPHGRDGSDPCLPRLWVGSDSLESAGERAAGRSAR